MITQYFVVVKTTIPKWALERYKLISKHGFMPLDQVFVQSFVSELLKTIHPPTSKADRQDLETGAWRETWISFKWLLVSGIKSIGAGLIGRKYPDIGPPFDTSLDAPCLVEFTVRRYWIRQIEKKVGQDPNRVSEEISKLLIDGLYNYFQKT